MPVGFRGGNLELREFYVHFITSGTEYYPTSVPKVQVWPHDIFIVPGKTASA
jgi:hypothetical protein